MTAFEALVKIRDYILEGKCSEGVIAPILNWCDEGIEGTKAKRRKEAKEIRRMELHTPMAKMFQEMLADEIEKGE